MNTTAFLLRLAQNEDDLFAAQRLRYRVFVEELGGDGPLVDHAARREVDQFDPFFEHLVLVDPDRPIGEHVVGVYRLLTDKRADEAGQFYSEDEYDLGLLRSSGRRLLELGRSCVAPEYRTGMALAQLWTGLADYVRKNEIEILFGVASFHGTDRSALAHPLSMLHHKHLAPEPLRVTARAPHGLAMDLLAEDQIDRRRAMRDTPQLIKSYLRLGGVVGAGAWIDEAFNTTDVCLLVDTARMNAQAAGLFTKGLSL